MTKKEKRAAYMRQWRKDNPQRHLEIQREYSARNRERKRVKDLERRYGLTVVEYDALAEAQGHVCAVCQQGCDSGHRLSVDHCHDTGRVRGLLCKKCNRAIGLLGDTPEGLRAAADYLENANA